MGKVLRQAKSQLEKKLDAVFSKYIRRKYSNDGEYVQCFTCGKWGAIKKMQAGHYHSRRFKSIRWDEKNVHVQCVGCNLYHEGNKPAYTLKLIEKYGAEVLQELEIKRVSGSRLDRFDLETLIGHYQKELKCIEQS